MNAGKQPNGDTGSAEDLPRPLGEHFAELRRRVIISIAAVAVAAATCWACFDIVNAAVLRPLRLVRQRLADRLAAPEEALVPLRPPTLRPTEGFMYVVKLGFAVGLLLASPIVLYQAWMFVAPGLMRRERRIVRPVFMFGALFFAAGAMMAYFWVVPAALYYLAWIDCRLGFVPTWRPAEYSSFLVNLLLVFGLAFELPLVMAAVGFAGLVQPRRLLRPIRYMIAAAFVLGAVLTPPDVASQLMMAVTLIALYALGVAFAHIGYRYSAHGRLDGTDETREKSDGS